MIEAFKNRRELVLSALREIEGVNINVPEGAFYAFPDVSYFYGQSYDGEAINNGSDLAMYLLNNANVALVTGEAFGDPNCIRISYAASEEVLTEAMKRIKESLEKLN